MTREEMLKLLELDLDAVPDSFPPRVQPVPEEVKQQYEEMSPYALLLDDWDVDRGAEILTDEEADKGLTLEMMADFHCISYAAFPMLDESCRDTRRLEFIRQLLDTPDYHSLHVMTQHDAYASEEAAHKFGEEYAKLLVKDRNRPPCNNPARYAEKAEADMFAAISSALDKAAEEVEEIQETCAALGCGPGPDGDKLNSSDVARLFKRIRNNDGLRKIVEAAGRFRRFARGAQRTKSTHGYEDMVGIHCDDRVEFLLAEELACLVDPTLENDTIRRLFEREMLATEYRGTDKVGKGPIVVCVDESGSMSGDPVQNAKAFALSMAWVARSQNRWCVLIGYAGDREGTMLALPPHCWPEGPLMDWLEHFYSGGTVMDVPLEELPYSYWPKILELTKATGKADVILITDAIVDVPPWMRDRFNAWKARQGAKVISLILNASEGALASVSDEVHLVNNIGLDSSGITRCLSI